MARDRFGFTSELTSRSPEARRSRINLFSIRNPRVTQSTLSLISRSLRGQLRLAITESVRRPKQGPSQHKPLSRFPLNSKFQDHFEVIKSTLHNASSSTTHSHTHCIFIPSSIPPPSTYHKITDTIDIPIIYNTKVDAVLFPPATIHSNASFDNTYTASILLTDTRHEDPVLRQTPLRGLQASAKERPGVRYLR